MGASDDDILRFIAESPVTISFSALKQQFCAADRMVLSELKQVVARLVKTGQLCYQYRYGKTILAISYDHPVAVSRHVILKPPKSACPPDRGRCVVSLEKGAAFGRGDHPTTRLAIQSIDNLLHQSPWQERRARLKAVDIGTGSGVLAIVAARFGVGSITAIDTDPCAVYEAAANVRLNQVAGRVFVRGCSLDDLAECYDLVFANLRSPTLLAIRDTLVGKSVDEGALILSGIKDEEADRIAEAYAVGGYFIVEKRQEKGWSALCLMRGDFPH